MVRMAPTGFPDRKVCKVFKARPDLQAQQARKGHQA